MKKVLIDTNIYSLAMKGDQEVVTALRQIDTIAVSCVSVGELYSGFKGGNREKINRNELDIFLDSPRVRLFSIDIETADFYSFILDTLRRKGTPIPTNDIWIAAAAFQHGLKLFSKDKHFDKIPGLLQYQS
jgi:tRNA(fMet)-specific endonuclease VapC